VNLSRAREIPKKSERRASESGAIGEGEALRRPLTSVSIGTLVRTRIDCESDVLLRASLRPTKTAKSVPAIPVAPHPGPRQFRTDRMTAPSPRNVREGGAVRARDLAASESQANALPCNRRSASADFSRARHDGACVV